QRLRLLDPSDMKSGPPELGLEIIEELDLMGGVPSISALDSRGREAAFQQQLLDGQSLAVNAHGGLRSAGYHGTDRATPGLRPGSERVVQHRRQRLYRPRKQGAAPGRGEHAGAPLSDPLGRACFPERVSTDDP